MKYPELYETRSVMVWKADDCLQPANALEASKGRYFMGKQV